MAEVVSCPPKLRNIKARTHMQAHTADPLLHCTVFTAHMRCQKYWDCYIKCVCNPLKEIDYICFGLLL